MSSSIHVPVLLYHEVNERGGVASTSPALFRGHLQWLARRGWKSLTLAEFAAMVTGKMPAEPRRFLLTYDDGSSDLTYCASVMEEFGFTGIAFVITGRIASADPDCISPDEARRMLQKGIMEFQSHTHRHVRVDSTPTDLEDLASDLRQSRAWFEKELGLPSSAIKHLAWPWGQCTPEMERMARQMGFDWQYLVQRGAVTRAAMQLRLPRLCADGMPLNRFSFWMTLLSSGVGGRFTNYLYGPVRRLRHGIAYW